MNGFDCGGARRGSPTPPKSPTGGLPAHWRHAVKRVLRSGDRTATSERAEPLAPDPQGSLVSEQLGLRLRAEGGHLNLYRLDTGQRLMTDEEARTEAETQREAEAEARRAAEAEVARLREELRRRGPA